MPPRSRWSCGNNLGARLRANQISSPDNAGVGERLKQVREVGVASVEFLAGKFDRAAFDLDAPLRFARFAFFVIELLLLQVEHRQIVAFRHLGRPCGDALIKCRQAIGFE